MHAYVTTRSACGGWRSQSLVPPTGRPGGSMQVVATSTEIHKVTSAFALPTMLDRGNHKSHLSVCLWQKSAAKISRQDHQPRKNESKSGWLAGWLLLKSVAKNLRSTRALCSTQPRKTAAKMTKIAAKSVARWQKPATDRRTHTSRKCQKSPRNQPHRRTDTRTYGRKWRKSPRNQPRTDRWPCPFL